MGPVPEPTPPIWVYDLGPRYIGLATALSTPLISSPDGTTLISTRTGRHMVFLQIPPGELPSTPYKVDVSSKHDFLEMVLGSYRALWWDPASNPPTMACVTLGHPANNVASIRQYAGLEEISDAEKGFQLEREVVLPEKPDARGWLFDEQSGRVVVPIKFRPNMRMILDFA